VYLLCHSSDDGVLLSVDGARSDSDGPTRSYSGPEFPYEKASGMIPFVIEMRGQAQVSSKQTGQTQKRLDELSKRRPEVHPAVTICVQPVYKKAGLKGLQMDLSNAESTTGS
jgi:hypothetical protein